MAFIDVDGLDFYAVALGVFDQSGRGVKAHRLGVQDRAGERLVVVASKPCGDVRQQCKGGCVTLREAVLTETTDLGEHALGKLFGNAFGEHAGDHACPVLFDSSGLAPRRHVTA